MLATSGKSKRDVVRQACDPCRMRKAKCESRSLDLAESHPHDETRQKQLCRRCVRLDLDCTYHLPFGVRGPRRKIVSALSSAVGPGASPAWSGATPATATASSSSASLRSSRNDTTSPGSQLYLVQSEPTRLPRVAQHWAVSPQAVPTSLSPTSYSQSSPGEDLCPRDLLKRILLDYLEYLYPLIPVVHRPSFRRDVSADRDMYDADFLGLILGLCAITVGTMPNRFKEYTTSTTAFRFRTRSEMIRYIYNRVHRLRGFDYFESISYHKWAVSYLLGIAFFQIGEHNQARMIEIESMQLARLLGLHQISEYMGLNCIETQLRKKAFWRKNP